jgi:hypothetical protein
MAGIQSQPQFDGLFLRIARMQGRQDMDGHCGRLAGRDERGHVKKAAHKRAFDVARLVAVDKDPGHVVDAVEIQPGAPAGIFGRDGELDAVPIGRAAKRLGPVVAISIGLDLGSIISTQKHGHLKTLRKSLTAENPPLRVSAQTPWP